MPKRPLSKEEKEEMEIFARNLRLLRTRAGYTQKQLGDLVGVTGPAIANLEYTLNVTSISIYKKLCRVLKQPAPPML